MISRNGITRVRVELATHDTDLKADVGDFSGRSYDNTLLDALGIGDDSGQSLYVQLITDYLDHGTHGLTKLSTDIAALLSDTESAGVVLGTKVAAYRKLVGESQIATTTEELNVGAGTLDLLTGTTEAVLLTAFSCKMPSEAAGGSITSIAMATDDSTPGVILDSTDGAVGNMASEAEFSWTGEMVINTGTIIQLTLAGGAHGSTYVVAITAVCEALADGGYLAVSA